MSDLINRQDAIEAIASRDETNGTVKVFTGRQVNEILSNLPSAEQKGKWIDRSDGGRIVYPWYETHECSQCGHEGSGAWEFCPNCGADMRGEDNGM